MAKVLFLSNHFITLYAFRKEIIEKMCKEGHEVYLSLPISPDNLYFEKLGCHIIITPIQRKGLNPIKDTLLFLSYIHMMRSIRPDIIFSFTIKPNIYGSIASRLMGLRQICNVTGTGSTFIKKNILGWICKLLYKGSMKYCYKVFFQNMGDMVFFKENHLVNDRIELIPGSGVNLDEHPYMPLPSSVNLNFIFIGRLMKLKGIDEYLECARIICRKYRNVSFYIAGWNEDPNCMEKVKQAQDEGIVKYLGFVKEIKNWIERCHCIIHPAHGGEGISNVLLECAAMGRVCIASDIFGCREIITDNISGYLFQKGNVEDLVSKVERFIALPDNYKKEMGLAGRRKVEKEFDRNIVVCKYMNEISDLRNE